MNWRLVSRLAWRDLRSGEIALLVVALIARFLHLIATIKAATADVIPNVSTHNTMKIYVAGLAVPPPQGTHAPSEPGA